MVEKNLASDYCRNERMCMIEHKVKGFPVSLQAELLDINRTSIYYRPIAPAENDLLIKASIDRVYMAHPEFGYRRITAWLNKYENMGINYKATLRHMREMGIQAVYPRENTSKPNLANKVYPYLLKGLISITRTMCGA